jgi:hypothetical protein
MGTDWHEIRCVKGTAGYFQVQLSKARKKHIRYIHILVLECFVGPRPHEGHHARHLDGNPQNNSVTNLAWGTPLENAADTARHGRTACGIKQGLSKLNEEKVQLARELDAQGFSKAEIARRLKISRSCVRQVVSAQTWKHVGEPVPAPAGEAWLFAE